MDEVDGGCWGFTGERGNMRQCSSCSGTSWLPWSSVVGDERRLTMLGGWGCDGGLWLMWVAVVIKGSELVKKKFDEYVRLIWEECRWWLLVGGGR